MTSLLGSIIKGVFLTIFVSFFIYGGMFFLFTDNKPRNLKELNASIKNIVNVKQNIKNMYTKSYNQVELMKAGNDEMVDETKKNVNESAAAEKKMLEQIDQENLPQPETAEMPKPKAKPIEKIDRSITETIELDLSKDAKAKASATTILKK